MANNQSLFSLMERVYGQALLDEAVQAGQVETIVQEVRQVLATCEQSPDFLLLMQNRRLGARRRAEIIARVFKGRVSDLLYRFFLVLNQRDRFDELPGIAKAFLFLEEQAHGVVRAKAFVAQPLDDATAERVRSRLEASINRTVPRPRTVALSQEIDARQIGGLKLLIGDTLVDGSIATQLRRLREQLLQAGQEKARARSAAL